MRFLPLSGAGIVELTGVCAVMPPPEIGVLTPGINTSRRTGIFVVFDESPWANAMEPYRLMKIKNRMARIAKRTFVESIETNEVSTTKQPVCHRKVFYRICLQVLPLF